MFWFSKKHSAARCACIVPAAGAGTRMQGAHGEGKQLIPLLGRPMLVHTLEALERAETVELVVVAAREAELPEIGRLAAEYGLSKVGAIVRGGETRMLSVAAGLAHVPQAYTHVAIHDGARPLCTPQLIDEVLRRAVLFGGAAAGVTPKDAIHTTGTGGLVQQALQRDTLVALQTPQAFSRDAYDAALAAAMREGGTYADDAAVYALLGKQVQVVPGSYSNIKVTTPEDVSIAELLLEQRL